MSQIVEMDYSVSYLLATSASGTENNAETGACEPLDINVGMNIDLKEFPKVHASTVSGPAAAEPTVTAVKFATTRDKFLQFSRDMRGALA